MPPAYFVGDHKLSDLHKLFYPESVAIVGASPDITGDRFPFFQSYLSSGYKGKLYPVNPKYPEIAGHKAFPSLLEIPGSIDLVVITLRAQNVAPVVADCVTRGTKFVVIFSSGFSEAGNEVLEEKVKQLASNGTTRLVGPNCLGPYCPEFGLSLFVKEPQQEPGEVAFVSQSGGHSVTYKTLARSRGIYFNKILSLGNQCDLTVQEVLRYYAEDPKIKVICAYVEQARGGREFVQTLREVVRKKPLILWKGGSTEAGARAAFSHTGAMASFSVVWQKAIQQLGVISVDDLEEMGDATVACLSMELPKGPRVGIVVAGGGSSVEMTDICARNFLEVPLMEGETQKNISQYIPDANTSCKNPVDLGFLGFSPQIYSQSIRQAAQDPNIDVLMLYQVTEYLEQFTSHLNWVETFSTEMLKIRNEISKPFVIVIPHLEQDNLEFNAKRQALLQKLRHHRIPVFPTVERAAKLLFRLQQHQRFLQQNG